MLNSAHLVTFPTLSLPSSPFTVPNGAEVKPSPIAPPMMLRPLIWQTSPGKVANRRAILVRAPVATRYAEPAGTERRASRIASIALTEVMGGEVGIGRRAVPSRPERPVKCQYYS